MTSSNDRRHRLQSYPVPVLNAAIDDIIYKQKDREIMRDMFTGEIQLTYDAASQKYNYSRTGMIKHVGQLTDRVETYLKNGHLN